MPPEATAVDSPGNELKARFQQALALHVHGQVKQAVTLYEQVLRQDSGHFGALVNLGNALRRLGRPDEALALYERALAIDDKNAELRFNLANAYRDLGRLDEAC